MVHDRIIDGMRTNLYDMKSRLIFPGKENQVTEWFNNELNHSKPFHQSAAVANGTLAAVIDERGSTTVVEAGHTAVVNPAGMLVITRA